MADRARKGDPNHAPDEVRKLAATRGGLHKVITVYTDDDPWNLDFVKHLNTGVIMVGLTTSGIILRLLGLHFEDFITLFRLPHA